MKIESISANYSSKQLTVVFDNEYDMQSVVNEIINGAKVVPVEDTIDARIRELISSNQFIEAIRYHKLMTGVSLKESKQYVDSLRF